MIIKVRAWESQILRLTFRPRRMPDETSVTYKIRTSRFTRLCWRKVGLPPLKETIATKIWTTMTWAVPLLTEKIADKILTTVMWAMYDGERQHGGEVDPSWGMEWDTYNVQRWKHRVGFHNRGVQWDTPTARWAGGGKDWIELMTQTQPRKEDVIRNLLESMKQPVDKKRESKRTCAEKETKGSASP